MEHKELENELEIIDTFLKDLIPGVHIKSMDFMEDLIKGNWVLDPLLFLKYIQSEWGEIVGDWKKVFITLLMLFIFSAFISAFMNAFHSESCAKAVRYLFLLCELVILVQALQEVINITTSTMDRMLEFVKLVIPTYMICIVAAGSGITASVFYKLLLSFICFVEGMLISTVVPVVQGYMILGIMESLSGEEHFSGMMELIRKGVLLLLKSLIVVVTGSGALQVLITPVVDKNNVIIAQKAAAAIPGIGDIAESIAGVTFASAVVVKNSLGVLILIVLVLCIIVPVMKIFLILGMFKIVGAIGGITGEKQMVLCVNYMTDAGFLFLRLLITVTGLFFIAIAALTNITGG